MPSSEFAVKVARLFNLESDPFEKTASSEREKGREIAQNFFEVLETEVKELGDELVFGKYPVMKQHLGMTLCRRVCH